MRKFRLRNASILILLMTKNTKWNPALAVTVEKPEMALLKNFADIVLKTGTLCEKTSDCIRLKNALVNLCNTNDWASLVISARSGALSGVNVLLRLVSANALKKLINIVISSFVYRETHRATEILSNLVPGGFLIISDEGKQWVDHPAPSVSLFEYSALEQWRELQRLSNQLLNTPFKAEGIVSDIFLDTNGTCHITLHNEPGMITLIRYLGTSLLLFVLIIFLLTNSWLCISRARKNRHRMKDIQDYYAAVQSEKFVKCSPPTSHSPSSCCC